jgi:hypothetical protein
MVSFWHDSAFAMTRCMVGQLCCLPCATQACHISKQQLQCDRLLRPAACNCPGTLHGNPPRAMLFRRDLIMLLLEFQAGLGAMKLADQPWLELV